MGTRLDILIPKRHADLARQLIDPGRVVRHTMPGSTLRDVAGFISTLGKVFGRYDVLLSLDSNIRAATLAASAGARTTIGVDNARRSRLYRQRLPNDSAGHAFRNYTQFLRCLGDSSPVFEYFEVQPEDQLRLDPLLKGAAIDTNTPYAVVHPGAGKGHRRWPTERFASVADGIVEDFGFRICMIAGRDDREIALDVIHHMRHGNQAACLVGPLGTLLPLLSRSKLLICNESGPMHLAAFTRCPIVAMFGPTRHENWAPLREGPDVAVLQGDRCPTMCGRGQCHAENACLTSISVDSVRDAARCVVACSESSQAELHVPEVGGAGSMHRCVDRSTSMII